MPRSTARRRAGRLLSGGVVALLALACSGPVPPPRPPVMLITLSGLRADAVAAATTPVLAALAEESDWSGTAVVASSSPPVSLASLLTGVGPWQHQLLSHRHPDRRIVFPTLAEVLDEAGYVSSARLPSFLRRSEYGLVRGVHHVSDLTPRRINGAVSGLGEGGFLWLHLLNGDLAYRRSQDRHPLLRRLPRWADPAVRLPERERDKLQGLYRDGVRQLDRRLARVLTMLRSRQTWDAALVVVTAPQGTELGEHGQILSGENLGRETIEVPLFVKLPHPWTGPPLAEPRGGRVDQTRIWPTVIEAVLGHAPARDAPIYLPSLFHRAAAPVLSALYDHNGDNLFSLLDGDLQLRLRSRFADPLPGYYKVRGSPGARKLQVAEDREFLLTPPLSGRPGGQRAAELERWPAQGTEPVDDPLLVAEMGESLAQRFRRFVPREIAPRRERFATESDSGADPSG